MAFLVTNYNFNKATKTITFLDYAKIIKESIDSIVNTTAGVTIYDEYDDAKKGTIVDNKVVLDYDTSSMNNTDVLEIWYTPIHPDIATQAEVDGGDIKDKYISPRIFQNSDQLKTIRAGVANFELELTRKTTGNSYSEITRVGGVVTKEEFYSDVAKTIKIFTKEIVYNLSGYPETITTTDNVTGKVMIETITWSGDEVDTYNKTVS